MVKPAGPFDLHVLKRLAKKPEWSQRFPKLKPVLDRLARDGYVKRVKAPGSKFPLMVEITDAGRARLKELDK